MTADAPIAAPAVTPAAVAAMLSRFTQVADAGGDARELTDWLLRQMGQLTGWPVAQALLVDPFGAVTIWFANRSNDTRWETYTLTLNSLAMRTPTGLIDRVMTTRRPGWVTDISTEEDYPRASAARIAGLRGVFAFPVVRSDTVVAVLQFLSPEPIQPSPDLQDAARIAGYLLGAAFDSLRLDGETADRPSRLHRIMDTGSSAFIATDTDGRVSEWTAAAERLFGWTRSEAMYRTLDDLITVPSSPHITVADQDDLTPSRTEETLLRRDGSAFPASIFRWRVPARAEGQPVTFLFFRDISTGRQRREHVTVDPLTGLVNSAGMYDIVAERLASVEHPRQQGHEPVLMLVGLQRFKEIDYSADRHVANEALRVISLRLAAFAREVDRQAAEQQRAVAPTVVGRVAADEFAVLVDSPGGTNDMGRLAERIVEVISEPFQAVGRRLALAAHVGVATPMAGSDVDSWFGDADAALYRARHGTAGVTDPRTRFEIEGFARKQGASWRQSLPAEMQVALHQEQFELYFQPIFSLPGRTLTGAEALIRWNHPQHGLLLPGAFIDAAEESGMINPIGEWVLHQASRRLHQWACPELRIAVNLCAQQLADPGIVAHVTAAVGALGSMIGDGGLTVEMTESVLMADPAVAATRIGQFRDMGVRVAIDDFGTGYSSMAYLKWFDVDVIKIDMSFVHGMETSRTDAAIVRTIIDLARELGLSVVAEGVETESQLRMLTDLGCSHVQGFALGRPSPASGFAQLLRR